MSGGDALPERIKFSDFELNVYHLLVSGKAQTIVAQELNVDRPRICRIAKKLVQGKYLLIETRGKTIFYQKGPEGPKLDTIKVAQSCMISGRGVTKVASKTHQVKTVNVHHLLYKCKVKKEGLIERLPDTVKGKEITRPFLTKRNEYRGGVVRTYGQVPYFEAFLTVFYETTPKGENNLYIFAPEIILSPEQWSSRRWKQMALQAVMEIAAYIEEHGQWQLELPVPTKWEKHFAIDDPALMKGFASHLFMKSEDGKAWTSGSDGHSEFETSEEEYVDVQLNIPGEIIKIKGTLREIAEAFQETAAAFFEILEAQKVEAQVIAEGARRQAQNTIEQSKGQQPDSSVASTDKYGVMYR